MVMRMMVADGGQGGREARQFVAMVVGMVVLVLLVPQILIEGFDLVAIGCVEQLGQVFAVWGGGELEGSRSGLGKRNGC